MTDGGVPTKATPSFREAVRFWARLGFVSFGGPAGQISLMHRETVEKRKWIDDDAFGRALAFCTFLPGPEAQQLATWIGWSLHGTRGAVAAGVLFVAPAAVLLLALSWVRAEFGTTPLVGAVLRGLRPVVAAIIIDACWSMATRRLKSNLEFALAAAALVAALTSMSFPATVAVAAAIGWFAQSRIDGSTTRLSPPGGPPESPFRRAGFVGLAGVLLWMMPWAFIGASREASFFADIYLFFTQTAFVTFGGAYAVLTYVSRAAVQDFRWLTRVEAIDGLALAETTPGPLIIVLQYIGFFAGWNFTACGDARFACGAFAAILTTWATFLPSIWLVVLGAPHVNRIAALPRLAAAFRAIAAAVTGVVLALGLDYGRAVVFPPLGPEFDVIAFLILAASFVALRFGRVPMGIVIAVGALAGCVDAALRSWLPS